jgi:SAM-dependent MidA family methyltransferase
MARELLAGFRRGGLDVDYTAVEMSAGARDALTDVVTHIVADLDDVPPIEPGLLVANELLDNLPFRRIRRRQGASVEVHVTFDGGRFVEVEAPIDDEPDDATSAAANDGEVVVPSGAFALVDAVGRTLRRGYALLIDYVPSAAGAPVRGYRAHRIVDVLSDPGSSDVTAGVDLDAVSARARHAGLVAFEHVDQRSVLLALGFDRWASDQVEEQGRLLNAELGAAAVRVWEGRGRARLLVDPLGLGALRWCVLATPGLEEPPWLTLARDLEQRDGDRA